MFELPKWVLMNKRPSTLDSDNLTVIEQTARIYGAMQELIKEYNSFVSDFEKEFNNLTDEDEEFKADIIKSFNDFTNCVSDKLSEVKTAIDNLSTKVDSIKLQYNAETEELQLLIGGEVVNVE